MTNNIIKPADLFGTEPRNWWQKWLCSLIGAKTFHWGAFVMNVGNPDNMRDWVTSESKAKGTSLSRFIYEHALVYRIHALENVELEQLIAIHSEYGDLPYDWIVGFRTAIWWIAKHYLGKIIRVIHDKPVNCQEWVVLFASELGHKIIPDNEYPMCTNLENSPLLELAGSIKDGKITRLY